jgi:DNA repair photolyase
MRDQLLRLLHPTRAGEQLAPGVRLLGASDEAGCRIDLEVEGRRVDVEVAPLEEPGPEAVRTARLRLYYNGPEADGLRACRAVAERAQANESQVLAELAAGALEFGTNRIRELNVTRLLEPAAAGRVRYHTLSPYVGCLIGCRFCYAQAGVARVRRLSGLPEVAWGSYADVRLNAPSVLARELGEIRPSLVKFCPLVSDPYQALEARYRLTRGCLEVLAEAPETAVLLLTRAFAIVEDVALLRRLPRLWAGVSIPTVDDEVRRHFEPRAASVGERLEILRTLKRVGVRTHAVVQPLLPGSIEDLAAALDGCADSVRIDVLHGEYGAVDDFAAHPEACRRSWQEENARALQAALSARGIPIWRDELPPELEDAS